MYFEHCKMFMKKKKNVNPAMKTEQLRTPSVNLNRKGRHSTKPGVKSGTTRLQIYREIFEKKQLNDLKKNVKTEKENKKLEKEKRLLDIEERHLELEQKKRRLTVLVCNQNGTLFANNVQIKTEKKVQIVKILNPNMTGIKMKNA